VALDGAAAPRRRGPRSPRSCRRRRSGRPAGHLQNFTDPLVDCRSCNERFREDQLADPTTCPNCGAKNAFTEARAFNLMFRTQAGPVEGAGHDVYLRPETAQGMFINFKNVLDTSRKKPPFGIAQMGKSFRNEITPGNFVFRTREFEQMELEFFVPPEEAGEWYEYWCRERLPVVHRVRVSPREAAPARPRCRRAEPLQLGHADVEFAFPWGWGELEGIAQPPNFDLKQHAEHSGERLTYFDPETNERYVPHVIEPAAGATRSMMAFLLAAYDEDEVNGETRTVLRFHPRLAPYKAAVLPLSKKDDLVPLAHEVFDMVKARWQADYDETQNIGKRYRRQDELGTPYCITVDFDSLEDRAVTVRDRDTTEQVRVPIGDLLTTVAERLGF
jgi:glycyl-tRNA synthetase